MALRAKMQLGCFVVFIAAFYLIGFYALGRGLWNARQSTQAATWLTAPATIMELELHEQSGEEPAYGVKVRYRYAVDGVEYEGSRLAFGYTGSSGKDAHEEIYTKLKEAKTIAARYDPTNPAESCLSFGMHRSIWMLLVFSVMWLSAITAVLALLWLVASRDTVLLDNLTVQ